MRIPAARKAAGVRKREAARRFARAASPTSKREIKLCLSAASSS
eukprot:CAMPEP_0184386626 /NCGR_PEP_ID=MMETSP0007-20130409/9957_1 /TAXON_ID=97485 /ORGANISM="Prymnesium parvum, Strain Texoma1" /LENGTH=43 /DNA_ID= /DNA_START= /DNA_END= /DNA_ORIENTATION=